MRVGIDPGQGQFKTTEGLFSVQRTHVCFIVWPFVRFCALLSSSVKVVSSYSSLYCTSVLTQIGSREYFPPDAGSYSPVSERLFQETNCSKYIPVGVFNERVDTLPTDEAPFSRFKRSL